MDGGSAGSRYLSRGGSWSYVAARCGMAFLRLVGIIFLSIRLQTVWRWRISFALSSHGCEEPIVVVSILTTDT